MNPDNNDSTFTNMLGEFRGPSFGFFNRARKSGFPAPNYSSPTPFSLLKGTPKKPFDDTLLNLNDSLLKKRRRKSLDESTTDNESLDTSIGTPWETKHLRTELAQARAEIKSMEVSIEHLHGIRKEMEIMFEREKENLKSSLEQERKSVLTLERRVKMVKRREEKVREELAEALSKVNVERHDHETKFVDLHEENLKLKDQLIDMEKEKKDVDIKLKTITMESEKLENELKLMTGQVESVNEKMGQLRRTLKDFEQNKAALTTAQNRIKELESEIISQNESAAVVKLQQAKLMKYSELERQLKNLTHQNAKLKESSSNSFYLESVVEELRTKLESMEEKENQLTKAKVEIGMLGCHLDQFQKLAEEIIGPGANADVLSSYVRKLQDDKLQSANQFAQFRSKVKNLEEAYKSSTEESEKYKEEITNLKKELESCNNNLRRLKKQNALITWERNDLRSLVDSCQKEVTVIGAHDPRTEALEKMVESYRNKLQQLEADPSLFSWSEKPNQAETEKNKAEIEKQKAELEKLREENQSMKAKIEKFEYELAHRALKGDFNNQNTKILHFKNNPVSEAIAKQENEVETLRNENAQLKERLRLIKEGQADITQNVVNMLGTDNSKECQELKEKLKSQEMQNQRLKEVFKKSLHEFREVIFALFGYKVDGLPNKLFRLSSLYAEAPDHYLMFKMSSTGEMEMLETEYSQTLGELIEVILLRHHSIPVFLSSLTIDLFKRQTNCVLDSTVQPNN